MTNTQRLSPQYKAELEEKIKRKRQTVKEIEAAIESMLKGEAVSSYSIGGRSISRHQLSMMDLNPMVTKLELEIAELRAILEGRPLRTSRRIVFRN